MSWINKLIYYNNVDDPEEFDIGTTFDKVYYKNGEGTITNFSLADFVGHIKTFFNEKRFMLWGNNQPEGSNTVEWYQIETVGDPIFVPLTISQIYNGDDDAPIQSGAYILKRKNTSSPYFLKGEDKVDAIDFTITNDVNQELQSFTLNNIYLDRYSNISNNPIDYYSYTLQNVITKKSYDIEIQIGIASFDKEDRVVNQISAKLSSDPETEWKQYYPTETVSSDNLINFEFDIDKYYTISFQIDEEIQEDFTLYVFPKTAEEITWQNILQGISWLEEYSWTTEDGSSYDFDATTITGDLTLFATSNSSSSQGTDGEQGQGTDGEQGQGTDENN